MWLNPVHRVCTLPFRVILLWCKKKKKAKPGRTNCNPFLMFSIHYFGKEGKRVRGRERKKEGRKLDAVTPTLPHPHFPTTPVLFSPLAINWVYKCAFHMCRNLQRSEEGFGCFGTGLTDCCMPSCKYGELNHCPYKRVIALNCWTIITVPEVISYEQALFSIGLSDSDTTCHTST